MLTVAATSAADWLTGVVGWSAGAGWAVRGVGLVVATGGCPVLISEAQLEGKRAAAGEALIQQLGAAVGERLG